MLIVHRKVISATWGSSSSFLVHLSLHYCDHALSVCPSVINFSHFRLLLWNQLSEFNETWQEARTRHHLPSLCFFGPIRKTRWQHCLWLVETFSTSLKPLKGIQQNLTWSKIPMSSTKFVFFGLIRKTRWPPWPLIGWDIFDFYSETAWWNSTKLDKKQDLNVLYQVYLFSCRSEKQDGHPGFWLVEIFSTSPLKLLNGFQRNLKGSKISTSSTKFVFRPVSKQKGPPWSIPLKGRTLYSGAWYVALWASCFVMLIFHIYHGKALKIWFSSFLVKIMFFSEHCKSTILWPWYDL